MNQQQKQNPAHFAFVLYRFFPHGGLQKDFLRVVNEVLARGHRVTVFLAEQNAPLASAGGLLTIRILRPKGFSNHARMISFYRKVKLALANGDFDRVLMFSRLPGGDFYFAADNCLAADWAKSHNNAILKILPRYRTFLALEREIFAGNSATHVFALVKQQKQDYQNAYHTPDERFTILPPGIDGDCRRPADVAALRKSVRQMYNVPQNAVLLIQVAAQFEVKGVDRSIAAVANSGEDNLFLLVAGGGKIEKYRSIAKKFNVSERIIFAGACDNIPQLIAAADLMIHPARKELTGTVIAESLAIGIPVISSAVCGYSCYSAEIDNRLVVPEPFGQDELDRALAFAISELTNLAAKTREIGMNIDFYSRAAVIADILEGRRTL